MKRLFLSLCVFSVAAWTASADLVSRDIGDPVMNAWKAGDWVTCGGEVITLDKDEAPRDPEAIPGAHPIRFECRYAPRAFGGWNANLVDNTLPGKPVRLTGWARLGNDKSWGMEFSFKDANGGEFKLSPAPYGANGKFSLNQSWQRFEMKFPAQVGGKPIAYPVKFEGVAQNNWGDKNNPEAVNRQFDLYDFRLETEMEGIAKEDRPHGVSMSFPVTGNVYYAGKNRAEMALSAYSWIGEDIVLKTDAKVVAANGEEKKLSVPDLTVRDSASVDIALPFTEPGAYTVVATVRGFPKDVVETHRFVIVLEPNALTPEQKRESSYGINVHGGTYVGYDLFGRLGFVWIRDYAYTFPWMNRARGEGGYGGWPWYPKLVSGAEGAGLMTLPCLMGAIEYDPKQEKDQPKARPSLEWRRDLARIVATFDSLACFELDNEKDGVYWGNFEAYGEYHKAFAEVVKAVRPDAWAVTEGSAGIYVDGTQKLVEQGYYKDIDVVNGHHYCGVSTPERSKSNLNTGMSEARKTYLRDVWRHWKKAACCDGKERQVWLTEWGFDTRAGQIVTEWEQASYLQREWVLSMGAGIDKMFWYWYFDSDTDHPQNFFDGCGIFDRFREPKPVAASFAALRSFLPVKAEYVGYANLDANHMAHVLKADGKLVAMAFKIDKNGADLEIDDPKAASVHDMFGAKLKAGKRTLDIAPTWYIGLDPSCDWLKQCPMDLESDFYVRNVPGEAVEVRTVAAEGCTYRVEPPKGWTATPVEGGFDLVAPADLTRGDTRFTVVGVNGKIEKRMDVEVDIVPQAYVKSHAADFDGNFKVEVVNQSSAPQAFTIRADLPEGWKVEPATQNTASLPPEERGTLEFKLVSSKDIPASEEKATPRLEVVNAAGDVIDTAPVVPREWTMHRVDPAKVKLDGDLRDWNATYQIPRWMLGPRGDKEASRLYLAYADDGLYLAADITDSKCATSDPNSFWRASDCIELLFFPPRDDFTNGWKWSPFDHQFWFSAMGDENRVFAGFWGNCEEQKTEGDLKDVKTALRKNDTGYSMEAFIPAARIHGWSTKKGGTCGVMLTVAVRGHRDDREVFWPVSKTEYATKQPWKWGKVRLGD